MSRSVLTNELFQQLVDDDVPFITVLHDAPKVGSGARRDAHCAHRTVPTLVPSFARRGEPTPMEGRDVPGHVTGGNDVVLERRVGPRQRDSGQNPEESRAVRSLCLPPDATGLVARHESLDLNMSELRTLAIAAKYIGIRGVAQRDYRGVAPSAQFSGNEELACIAASGFVTIHANVSRRLTSRISRGVRART